MNSRSAASIAPRLVAAIALGSALALGTTGCTFITHQATTNPYPASDGVPIDETGGDVIARNVFIVTTEDGEIGSLVGAFINEGDKTTTVDIDVADEQLTLRVPSAERVSLGAEEMPLRIENLGVKPGATVEVLVISGDGEAVPAQVPVLDGSLPQYADLVPAAEPLDAAS
ncbi:DNA modification methylase [Microbacterium esteraromaticum]|uniref:DNA modification methylase n=1 Tax=Microbacterium esteraromaticum TaxID=57043 RepID=A0A7D8AHB0_9MICO|nr:DNA modification methylase [Microbacterium esteraromaticum]QMU96025.1 DNA modification methylase [Microbacterium esteraromaticum]